MTTLNLPIPQVPKVTPVKILCPHDAEVDVINMLGIVYYEHVLDKKPCMLLNKFAVSAELILRKIVKDKGLIDDPDIRAALSCDAVVRKEVFPQLATLKDEEFYHALCVVLKAFYGFQNTLNCVRALIEEFGSTMADNIKQITGEDYSQFVQRSKKYTPCFSIVNGHTRSAQGAAHYLQDRRKLLEEQIKQAVKLRH